MSLLAKCLLKSIFWISAILIHCARACTDVLLVMDIMHMQLIFESLHINNTFEICNWIGLHSAVLLLSKITTIKSHFHSLKAEIYI